jgi:hypothetical protein
MKRNILVICAIISLQYCGQSQIKIKDKNFAEFINKISEEKIPAKCKTTGMSNCFRDKSAYKISLEEAEKYLGYSNEDYYITKYDYDMDEDKISNIRRIEHAPFADRKILQKNYAGLLYYRSCSQYVDECDTVVEILNTYTLKGEIIDKITIQGHYTNEFDWIDFIFLSNNTFKIFNYKPNMENYNVEHGIYYIIDEKKAQTTVEIKDYRIDENGKIDLVKTYPKEYLKNDVIFYKNYHEDSDDPMNRYD